MSRRRPFLQRSREARARRARDSRNFDPTGLMRLAGFGAALMVFLAVYVGFRRSDESALPGPWGVLSRFTEPLIFGVNGLELLALLLAAFMGLRYLRRMQGKG
jgi:hypothetical protein